MLIGRWTRECGCGYRAVLSSNNSSTAIARWDSAEKLIRMAITLGNFRSLLNDVSSALEFRLWLWLSTSRNLYYTRYRMTSSRDLFSFVFYFDTGDTCRSWKIFLRDIFMNRGTHHLACNVQPNVLLAKTIHYRWWITARAPGSTSREWSKSISN